MKQTFELKKVDSQYNLRSFLHINTSSKSLRFESLASTISFAGISETRNRGSVKMAANEEQSALFEKMAAQVSDYCINFILLGDSELFMRLSHPRF